MIEYIKMSSIVELYNGYAFKSNDYIDSSNTLNCRMSNIRPDGSFDILYSAKYLPDEYAHKYSNYLLNDGDLIIAMTDMAGDPKILGIPTVVNTKGYNLLLNQRVGKLKIINDNFSAKYLKFALSSKRIRDYFKSFAGGGVQLNVGKKEVLNAEIVNYPVDIQSHIVTVLETIQSIITHRKQQLAKLDELIKARFVEMFGEIDLTPQRAEWTPISTIGTVIGGSTPKTSVEEYWDGDLKWITPAELLPDTGYLYDSVRKITKAGADSCSLQLLPKDTVILTSRAPIGKVAIAGTELYCNQGFKNIICNDSILPRYLYSLLLYNVDYLNSLGRGATFKEISKSIVEKIKIPIAPIEQQEQFAAFVERIDKSKVVVQKALDEAQLLFDSLMQEYFG